MKAYVETLEGQFIATATDDVDAVLKFIRNCIGCNTVGRCLRMHFWVHEGIEAEKRAVSFVDVANELTRGEWRFLCFSWYEKRGARFMKNFAKLVSREIEVQDFEE